ncbi:MAG: hypothetical protein K2Q18_17860 [Bdellovibrionales bacterium]|nr:hypothetical protein [Bdellovibrionales bacterium]
MKIISTLVMAFTLSTTAMAADLNETALKTLLSSPEVTLEGDVHSYETVGSIYAQAVGKAKIKNECIVSGKTAKCILWINYSLGETALEYSVDSTGETLLSSYVSVARGD